MQYALVHEQSYVLESTNIKLNLTRKNVVNAVRAIRHTNLLFVRLLCRHKIENSERNYVSDDQNVNIRNKRVPRA
jgi:hypothetical protein